MYVECQLDPSDNVCLRFCYDSKVAGESRIEHMLNWMENALRHCLIQHVDKTG
jgi:hypothetical protein